VIESQRRVGMWKWVKNVQVAKGCGSVCLDQDHVFSHEGEYLEKDERNLTALASIDEGFIIWGEYVVSRMLSMGVKRKRSKKGK
jgi:hypothetical protein